MKSAILTVFVVLFSFTGFSQGEFNNWYFGTNKAITFNSGVPVLIFGSALNAASVTVNVSDSTGNLWFYSDGNFVWNRNNVVMPNGSGLYGSSASFAQTIIAIQNPADDSIFLFGDGRKVLFKSTGKLQADELLDS